MADQKDLVVDLSVKHPLSNNWTLWFYENDPKKSWTDNQKMVTNFSFVEDFWSIYNHLKLARELPQGCDYAIFKSGIRPMWEDETNEKGGRWVVMFTKKEIVESYWLELLLLLLGEGFGNLSNLICGAVVNIRKNVDKLALWIKAGHNKDEVHEIGSKIKNCLATADDTVRVFFESHQKAQKRVPHGHCG